VKGEGYVIRQDAYTGTMEPLVALVAVEHELPIVMPGVTDTCDAIILVLLYEE
jgi:hypothetical protein